MPSLGEVVCGIYILYLAAVCFCTCDIFYTDRPIIYEETVEQTMLNW